MFCDKCGKEIADNSEFCGYCGHDLRAPTEVEGQAGQSQAPTGPDADASPPGSPAAPPTGTPMGVAPAGAPVQPCPETRPPKKSVLPWVLGGIGLVAVVAVVLVLVFVVFRGDGTSETSSDTTSDVSGPEEVVEKYCKALEKQDADMLLGIIEPSFREQLEEALGENLKRFFEEYFFSTVPEDLEITVREMDTEIDGDNAVVKVVDGTMTYTDEYGDKVSEEASQSEIAAAQLVRVDGNWYLSGDTLKGMGVDPDKLKDLVLGELTDTESLDDSESSEGTGADTFPPDESTQRIVLPIDSEEEAYAALLNDHGIYEWFLGTEEPLLDVTEESDRYVFYLYELDADGNEVPFWWFGVDKETGAVFEITND